MATGGGVNYTPERQNFARLSACIIGPCTQMMRDLLRRHVAPANLRALVKQHVKVKLNYEQKNQLLPGLVPDYSNFDLTFTYLLLRTPGICSPTITPPTNNCGIPPNSSLQITVGDDIERVRLLKNEICSHIKTPELKQQEFNDQSAMITDIAVRFDTMLGTNGKFVTEITDLLTQPLDGPTTELYIEQIQEMTKDEQAVKETVGEIKKEVGGMKEDVSGLKKDVSGLTTEVCGIKEDVGGLTTEVGEMKKNVGGMKENVGGLTTEVGGMKEDVGGLTTEVGEMKKNVGGLTTEVGEMKKDVGGLTTEVGEMKKDVGGLTTEVGEMKKDVGGMKEDVGGLTTEVGEMKENVGGLTTEVGEMKKDVGGMKEDVGGLTTEVGEMKKDVGGLTTEVGGMKEDVGGLTTEVGEIKKDVGGMKEDVGGLKTEVGGMKENVGGLTTEVGEMKKDVGGLTTEVGGMKKEVGGMKEDVGRLKTEVGGLKMDVGGLKEEVGGLKKDASGLTTEVSGMKKDVGILTTEVGGLKGEVHGLRDEFSAFKSFQGDLRLKTKDKIKRSKLIDKSKREIERFNGKVDIVKISAHDIILAKLRKDGLVTVTGIPGDGKTTTAFHVMKQLMYGNVQGVKKKLPLIISKPSEWEELVERSENLIIFIDNMFGISSVTNTNEWKVVMKDVEDVCTDENDPNRNFLIVAVRNHILNDCPALVQKHMLFESMCNLRDEKNFSKEEKLEFFEKRNLIKFTQEERKKIIERTKFLGFPQCCSLFVKNIKFQEKGIEFFFKPVAYLKDQLRDLRDDEEIKFVALALLMLNGGELDKEKFNTIMTKEKIKDICRRDSPDNTWRNCLQAARSMEGTYLDNKEGVFTFSHDSIHDAVASIMWKDSCTEVIQNCSFDFLTNVYYEKSSNLQSESVTLPKKCISVLTERILTEISTSKPEAYKSASNLKVWADTEIRTTIHEAIIKHSVNINKEDEDSKSLLHHAVRSTNIPLVKYLYTRSPSDQQSHKAFNISCEVGDIEMFNVCKEHYHQIDLGTFFSAVKGGNEEIYKQLISTTTVNIADKYKSSKWINKVTILQEICLHGKGNLLKLSIQHMTNEEFMSTSVQQELLIYAGRGGCVDMLKYLIEERGMDVYHMYYFGTVLHYTCLCGNLDAVKYLSSFSGIMKMKDFCDSTALHYVAVGSGSVDVAEYLINKGVDIKAKDKDGATMFHLACKWGHLSLLQLLHDKDDTLIKLTDNYNRTTLHYVADSYKGSVDVAEYLINKGVDIKAKDMDGATVCHFACRRGHLSLLQLLHDKDDTLIKLTDNDNWTALHYIADEYKGSVDVAEYLINKGVDIKAKDKYGATVCHLACRRGHLSLLQLLHDKDHTLIKLTDNDNRTPLHYVADRYEESVDVAECLINKGVDIKAKDKYGATVCHLACERGHLSLLQLLHDKDDTLIKLTDNDNRTPLHYVADGYKESVDVAEYLINKGVDIKAKDGYGATVCHLACQQGHLSLLQLLHDKDDTLIKLTDNENRTTLHYVAERSLSSTSTYTAAYLISKGINVQAKDVYGKTALDYAKQRHEHSLIQLISNCQTTKTTKKKNECTVS